MYRRARYWFCIAVLLVSLSSLAGCSWLARYNRALESGRIPLEPVVKTSPHSDSSSIATNVQTAIGPRMGFIASAGPLSPENERLTFTVPPGFEVQLVVAEPDIHKPMQLAFDERGRLLVSTSTEYPLGVKPGETPEDRVMLIEIDGVTGAARKFTTFADGLNICSGIEAMPGGRVIVGHAPDILLLTDADGDGDADTREVLYTGFARDDTHELPNSFTWGIDGWLYGLQGHVNESDVRDRSGAVTPIHHGNVYRMRPDGSKIEVWARGMSNPWGLTFDLHQNLYGSDCESRPLWQIVAGLPYQGFLQATDPLGSAPFITEDPHGASGFAGLVSYTAEAYPDEYRDCLFLGNPITGRIHRDRPSPVGSTHLVVRQPDFLVSTDPWFRPVDVELGPDGALYVADWYNSVIAHVEVPLDHPSRDKTRGRIWRIVYRGSAATGETKGAITRDWGRAGMRDLVSALGERSTWIRRMAAAQLRARFSEQAVKPCQSILLGKAETAVQRSEAFWFLHTQDALPFEHVAAVLHDPDPWLRRDSARALGAWPSSAGKDEALRIELLVRCLSDLSPYVVREAAMGLRNTPAYESLQGLLSSVDNAPVEDTLLRYALKYAARDQLTNDRVISAVEREVRTPAGWKKYSDLLVATQTAYAAKLLSRGLSEGLVPPEMLRSVLENIFAHGDGELIRETVRLAVAGSVLSENETATYTSSLFRNLDRVTKLGFDPKPVLESWCGLLARSTEPRSRRLALEVAAALRFETAIPVALEIVRDRAAPQNAREFATRLLMTIDPATHSAIVRSVIADASESIPARRFVAREFSKYIGNKRDFDQLVFALKGAPSDVYAGAIESLSLRKPGAILLLDAVESEIISPAYINTHITRIRYDVAHKDAALLARYDRLVERAYNMENEGDVVALAARFAANLTQNSGRDARNGRRVFEENCIKCHRIGGVGALIAPNLDGIRNRGVERVLQDVMTPNLDIDPAFRTTIVSLSDGDSVNGLVVREDANRVVFADAQGQERAVPAGDIVERTKLLLSPMPTGFGTTIPEKDFLDLIGYLMNAPETGLPASRSSGVRN